MAYKASQRTRRSSGQKPWLAQEYTARDAPSRCAPLRRETVAGEDDVYAPRRFARLTTADGNCGDCELQASNPLSSTIAEIRPGYFNFNLPADGPRAPV